MAAREARLTRLEIRPLESAEECALIAGIQKRVWGFDIGDFVAPRLFRVFGRIGGSCLGAFLDEDLVGYTLAFAGFKPGGTRYWHSHMAAVEPALQHMGIGYRLKLEQRREALRAGLELIEWTFDPLQARNAYFNVEKLGVDVSELLPNFYGITSSDLHGHLPTDRLVAAWHLRSPKVLDLLGGKARQSVPSDLAISIPSQIADVARERAAEIQRKVRDQFRTAFRRGMTVRRFERSGRTGIYHLAA